MNSDFVRSWAIAVTAIALILLGILIGQWIYQKPQSQSLVDQAAVVEKVHSIDEKARTGTTGSQGDNSGTGSTGTEGDNTGDQPATFVVPEAFTSLPSEWHTVLTDGGYDGYAIVFDPPRREVIIEQCRHPGYFNMKTGQPVADGLEFCTIVLWGEMQTMDESSAQVKARAGELLDLTFSLTNEDKQSQLALSFPGHQMNLVSGSKNDLYQAMESAPAMMEQKRLNFEFQQAEYQMQRQQQLKAAEDTKSKDQQN